jgi:hypothetical protein
MKVGDLVNFVDQKELGWVVGFTPEGSPIIRWNSHATENGIHTNGSYIEEYLEVIKS